MSYFFRPQLFVIIPKSLDFPGGSGGKKKNNHLGQEDPLDKGTAIHFSILACRIPWTEELAGCGPQDLKKSDMTEET